MDKLELGVKIISKIEEKGYQAYIVGGAVRDYILGLPATDIDLATNAPKEELIKLFTNISFEGEKYNSMRIIEEDMVFEITGFRKDISYEDHRHPITILATCIEEDLARRDFTINAMAMDKNYNILDLFCGKDDLKKGIIRTIRNAETRFFEDALRVLRAVYFSSKLDFSLDKDILNSLSNNDVRYLKEEYIISMLELICSMPFDRGLQYIKEYNILKSFPFYQVVAEEALEFGVKEDIFALFYCRHHFLPKNVRLKKSVVRSCYEIAELVNNEFHSISLYYGKEKYYARAIILYNAIYGKSLVLEEVLTRKKELPIHSSKDIHFDFNELEPVLRGKAIKEVETAILRNRLENKEIAIRKFLEVGD